MSDPQVKHRWFQFSLRNHFLAISVLAGYAGAYCALLQPVVVVEESLGGMVVSGYREPRFRFGGETAQLVFAPLSWIDHAVRPSYWDRFSDFDEDAR